MGDYFLKFVFAISMVLFIVAGLSYAGSIPDMEVSYSTGECVRVINYADTDYSCENQPQKYNHIWTK